MTNTEAPAMTGDSVSHEAAQTDVTDIDRDKETDSFLSDLLATKQESVSIPPEDISYKDLSLCSRLKLDHPFRRRYFHTIFLFWTFIGLGWIVGLNGPTFPDLRQIVQQDLDTASWLFTTHSIGYLIGSFVGGILYDRFNKLLLLVFSIWLSSVTTAIVPWCSSFPLMLAIKFVGGLGCGSLDTGGNADLVSIWDQEGRSYMQALQFVFGIGGIFASLLAEPFLARKHCIPLSTDNSTDGDMLSSFLNVTLLINTTEEPPCIEEYGETKVHYAYMISAGIIFTTSLPLFSLYLKSLCQQDTHMIANKDYEKRPEKLPRHLKIILLILLCSLMGVYCAVEDTYAGFLMTFCINHLNWTKVQGSFATSAYWISFSVGRFSGIFLIRCVTPLRLLCSFYTMLFLGFLGLLISTLTLSVPALWIFMIIPGYALSVIFGCIFTWTEERILEVTGMVSSLFLISASAGLMLNPMLLGYLMDNYNTMSFVYLLLAESAFGLGLLMVIIFLVNKYVKIDRQPHTMEMEISPSKVMQQCETFPDLEGEGS